MKNWQILCGQCTGKVVLKFSFVKNAALKKYFGHWYICTKNSLKLAQLYVRNIVKWSYIIFIHIVYTVYFVVATMYHGE